MKIYSTTELRANLSDIVNTVHYQKKIVAVGRNKKAEVFIVPAPEEYEVDLTEVNSASSSFDFLAEEPDLYTVNDLKVKYV